LSGLLVAASLVLALSQRPPTRLKLYLLAQLVYVPFVWAAYYLWDEWSVGYAAVYVAFTVLILLAIVGIVMDFLADWRYPARLAGSTFLLAMVIARIAFLGSQERFSDYGAISLTEGFFLAWAGTLALFAAPYTKRPDFIFPLGLLWIAQAAYDFGWMLHGRLWDAWNWIVPPGMCVCCFLFLAARLAWTRQRPSATAG
jgi:hypothetical protein